VLKRIHHAFIASNRLSDKFSCATALVNRTCGLHIHIGNQHFGFPLRTVKNLVTNYIINKRIIDGLHSASRAGGSKLALSPLNLDPDDRHGIDNCIYNSPWSEHMIDNAYRFRKHKAGFSAHKLALPLSSSATGPVYPENLIDRDEGIRTAAFGYNYHDWITLVDKAPTLEDLKKLQAFRSHGSILNISNLRQYRAANHNGSPEPGAPTVTVEFRQHAGTFRY
jgi:hypothetical protein